MGQENAVSEMLAEATRQLAEARVQLANYDASFELYDDAMRRGTAMWRAQTSRDDVLPDTAKLVAWLLGRIDKFETELVRLRAVVDAMKVLTAKDAMALRNVCMSFQAQQIHKQDETGAKFWRDLAGRLSKFAAGSATI